MTPATLFLALRTLTRLGGTFDRVYRDKLRGAEVTLPPLPDLGVDTFNRAKTPFLKALEELNEQIAQANAKLIHLQGAARAEVERGVQPLIDAVNRADRVRDPTSRLFGSDPDIEIQVIELAEPFLAEKSTHAFAQIDIAPSLAAEPMGAVVLQQFIEGRRDTHPLTRIGLALADTALDFAATKPTLFGVSSNGERLLRAVTMKLGDIIPPDEQLTAGGLQAFQQNWLTQTTGLLFRSGLEAVSENVDHLLEEDHLKHLAGGVLKPMTEMFDPDKPYAIPRITTLRNTLMGPMSKAVMASLCQYQSAFLGEEWDPDKTALGSITASVLGLAQEHRVSKVFSHEGILSVYRASLDAVAQRPDLFLRGDSQNKDFARNLLGQVAGYFSDPNPAFERELAPDLCALALGVVAEHAPARLGEDTHWDRLASDALVAVLTGFQEGVKDKDVNAFKRLFSRQQRVDLVKMFMQHAAATPGMLVGGEANEEIKRIASAVASLLAEPEMDLLAPEAMRDVAFIMLTEASRNPGVLFSLEEGDQGRPLPPERHLAVALVKGLLAEAGNRTANLTATGAGLARRKQGVVLFGQTLADAMTTLLRAAGSNLVAGVNSNPVGEAQALAARLNQVAANPREPFGAREWLYVYRAWIADVLQKGTRVADISDERLLAVLDEAELAAADR